MLPTEFQLLVLLAQGPKTHHEVAAVTGTSPVVAWFLLSGLESRGLVRSIQNKAWWELVDGTD